MNRSFTLKKIITKAYKLYNASFQKNPIPFRTLMYHSVKSENKKSSSNLWQITRNQFLSHLNYLIDNQFKFYDISFCLNNVLPSKGIAITFDDGLLDTYKIAAPILLKKNIPFTIFVITDNIRLGKNSYMNESQLVEISKNPLVTIGSHSKSHKKLSKLSHSIMLNEIKESKDYLEQTLGNKITAFSYPYGIYNKKTIKLVRECGYEFAFSSKFNANYSKQCKYSLSRSEIWDTDNLHYFKEKINCDWDWLKYRTL